MRVITLLQSTFKCLLWMFLMLCTSCLSACASDACARFTIFVVAFVCKESNEIFHFLWQRESQLPVNICLSSQHITAMDVCASEDRVWNENKNQFTREREIAKVARLTEDIPLSDPFYRYSALLFLWFLHFSLEFTLISKPCFFWAYSMRNNTSSGSRLYCQKILFVFGQCKHFHFLSFIYWNYVRY